MSKKPARAISLIFVLVFILSLVVYPATQASAISSSIVISQVYGGGGNSGATLKNDFIELYNLGSSPVDVTGWSVQYASSAGSSWNKTVLSGTIDSGHYYLIQEAAGAGGSADLPAPNATGSINMSATSAKVALVNNATTLTGTCPSGVVDFVGYGSSANCYEGSSPTGTLSNTTAALRNANGASDTDDNAADFTVGAPNPRNTPPPDAAPFISATTPADGASDVALDSNLTVTFSEPVDVTGSWFTLSCSVSGPHTAAVSGGPTDFTLNPDSDFVDGDNCTLTISASQVSDQDTNDPPDNMTADFSATFSTGSVCALAFTPIYSIQGSGGTAAITGNVVTQGVVVGDYEGPAPALRGFYLEDPNGDGNPATSDGIFIYNGNNDSVNLGDLVRVSGAVSEYQDQTEISAASITNCGSGSVAPVDVTLPFSSADYLERYEGMLVRLPQTLYVTEIYELGRFGQVVMSAGDRLREPTNVVAPGAPALALQAANDLDQIIIDDALNNQDPDPILFGRGGNPLSADNTLRGGDSATGIVGVMTYTWAGDAASGNAWRVRPVDALGGGVPDFQPTNPRPTTPENVGGSLKVVGMNLLNFFNTFGLGACAGGVDGEPTDCRGADSQSEFDRQWPKTVAAILDMNADVIGVNEIENDGYGPDSAIQFLVDKLNQATAPGTYAFIDVDANTGQVNALGTDAIKVGMLYKPASVTPIGQTAALNSVAFVNGGDSAPRNRPSLAQAFEQNSNGAQFIVDLNHLKSKGSACDVPDAGDGQGNCNAERVNAAHELVTWLASNPTGINDPNILLIGDYNSYAMEDPITVIKNAGYTNLIAQFIGPEAYSYVFDAEWGYLDHALSSPSLLPQITGVTEWHINSDEPSELDYNTGFKSPGQIVSLYNPDQYRISDHDPVIVGLSLNASCNGLTPTIVGTPGDDVIYGTNGNDVIAGLGGNDIIYGGNGNDVICGDTGDDTLYGGNGNDILIGGLGNDTLDGGNGNDTLTGNDGADKLYGQNGDDVLNGGSGDDLLDGANGNDVLNGGAGNDTLDGGNGNDILNGGADNDTLMGKNGNDTLTGDPGADSFSGGLGNDTNTDFNSGEGDLSDGS